MPKKIAVVEAGPDGLAAILFYRAILEEVRANRSDVFTRRNVVSNHKKKEILAFLS
mgnify:CR=1 FL=1